MHLFVLGTVAACSASHEPVPDWTHCIARCGDPIRLEWTASSVPVERLIDAACGTDSCAVLVASDAEMLGPGLEGRWAYGLRVVDAVTHRIVSAAADPDLTVPSPFAAGGLRAVGDEFRGFVLRAGPTPDAPSTELTEVHWNREGAVTRITAIGLIELGVLSSANWNAEIGIGDRFVAASSFNRGSLWSSVADQVTGSIVSTGRDRLSFVPVGSSGPLSVAVWGDELLTAGGGRAWQPMPADQFFGLIRIGASASVYEPRSGTADEPAPVVLAESDRAAFVRYAAEPFEPGALEVARLAADPMIDVPRVLVPTPTPSIVLSGPSPNGGIIAWFAPEAGSPMDALYVLDGVVRSTCETIDPVPVIMAPTRTYDRQTVVIAGVAGGGALAVLSPTDPGSSVEALWIPSCRIEPGRD